MNKPQRPLKEGSNTIPSDTKTHSRNFNHSNLTLSRILPHPGHHAGGFREKEHLIATHAIGLFPDSITLSEDTWPCTFFNCMVKFRMWLTSTSMSCG